MSRYLFLPVVLAAFAINAQPSNSNENDLCMKGNSVLLMPVKDIISDAISAKSSQTGGSLTALSATLGVSTMIMTFQISKRLEKDSTRKEKLNDLLIKLKAELKQISCFVDEDKEIYNQFLVAGKLPSNTDREKIYKDSCFQTALKNATILPISASKHINAVLDMVRTSANLCSSRAVTDLYAATSMLSSAEVAMLSFANYNAAGLEANEAKSFIAQSKSLDKERKSLLSGIAKVTSK